MLNQKTKILIIAGGAVLILAIIAVSVFGIFRKPPKEIAPKEETEAFEIPDLPEPSIGVEDTIIDFENPGPLSGTGAQEEADLLEARDLGEFFIERFGTYNQNTVKSSARDLFGFMTASMRDWTERYLNSMPQREGSFFVSTDIMSTEAVSFSSSSGRAEFLTIASRTEGSSDSLEDYTQKVRVRLEKDILGEWKVSGLFWEERL